MTAEPYDTSLDARAGPDGRGRRGRAHAGFGTRAGTGAGAGAGGGTGAGEAAGHAVPMRRRRPFWRSPLTRRILALNMLVLLIPVLGLLHLDQYRQTLIDSELKALQVQAETFALAIGSAAVQDVGGGEQRLVEEQTRQTVRLLLSGTSLRARVFARDGRLAADSFLLMGPGGQVQVMELPPPETGNPVVGWIGEVYDAVVNGLPGNHGLPRYREAPNQTAEDYGEVGRALTGEPAGRVRVDGDGRLVLSAAVPVQRYRQVMGALMLTKDGTGIERAVRDRRHDILLVFGIALAVTVLLSLYLARTIALPIRRLAEGADRIRAAPGVRGRAGFMPGLSRRHDEIGDLALALQAMTDALNARMQATEAFAADVAHEIKNPLTSLRSAVETAARIEDPDQQKKLMSIIVDDVQRLDRLISDISDASRLDAELARADAERVDVAVLLATLADVYGSVAEQRGVAIRVEADPRGGLAVQGLEGRLGQVFRNLLTNAISFSPPGGTIRLDAWRDDRARAEGGDWVVVTVADEGPGLPPGKLEAIFDRFYSERPEGEKYGTHSGLGLSISKQIVDAHGGVIYAENLSGGRAGGRAGGPVGGAAGGRAGDRGSGDIAGARFTVRLPAA